MRSRQWTVLLSVLLIGLLMMSACAPRATAGEGEAAAGEKDIVVDLPALVLDIQEDGSLSMGGLSLADLGAAAGQADMLAALSVPPDTVDAMVGSKIQHIQIGTTPEGILVLVNGKAIPSIAWDGDALVTTAEVVDQLGVAPVALLDKLLPLIQNIGIGVVVRAPVPEGVDALPLVSADDDAAERAMSAQAEFLKAVITPPTFSVGVNYAEDGSWDIAGISKDDLASMVPGLADALPSDPAFIATMDGMGIDQLGVSTNEDGFFISINGKNLPYVTWADGRINNVLALAAETGMLDEVVPGMDAKALLQYVDALLPAILASQISLNINFP